MSHVGVGSFTSPHVASTAQYGNKRDNNQASYVHNWHDSFAQHAHTTVTCIARTTSRNAPALGSTCITQRSSTATQPQAQTKASEALMQQTCRTRAHDNSRTEAQARTNCWWRAAHAVQIHTYEQNHMSKLRYFNTDCAFLTPSLVCTSSSVSERAILNASLLA